MSGHSSTRELDLRRLAWRLDTTWGLVGLFAAAFLLRVLIAPHTGFYGDLRLFGLWAQRLDDVGPRHFYVEGQFADYPPGYLYVLWLIGKMSSPPGYTLLKLPAILADLGIAWVAGTIAARIAPASLNERWPVRTLVVAATLFNPAFIALSAVWGQVDAVPAFFILASLLLLFTGAPGLRREIPAFLLFGVAVAMKPQSGFVLPVMLYALYRRYLHRHPRSEWLDGVLAIGVSGVLSLAVWAVSGLAFGLGPVSLLRFYRDSASVYPVTSANAFNLWGAVGFWRPDSVGDNAVAVAGVSALHLGELAFLVGIGVVLWRAHRELERGAHAGAVLMVSAAAVGLLGYTFLTRMHERYMFVSLACLAPLVFVPRLRLALIALSALFILNLWYPYAFFNAQWHVEAFDFHPWFGWLLGGFDNDTWQKKLWSLAVVAVVLAVAWFGAAWSARGGAPAATGEAPPRRLTRPRSATPAAPAARIVVEPPATERDPRAGPLALVALACLFGLLVLHGQTWRVENLNDSAFHLQMIRWANGQIGEGRVPLDGWYPYLSLGSSQFHHYQSLPHTLTAYATQVTGASVDGAYRWIVYLLLALWPIAVYLGSRLLGWGRWTAAASAAIAPLLVSSPGYGFEQSSYTWQGGGVYSQLWAMWLLPLTWGLTWRAVSRGRFYAAAVAATALTIACHFIIGYLAVLTIGVWVIVLAGGFLVHVGRAAIVVVGSVLVAAWVLVPLIADTKWTTESSFYKGSTFNDSFGAQKILGWLFTGRLFDDGRFPIVTLLFFAGLLICLARVRHDLRARALLGALTLSLLLFFGRRTFGSLIDLLPGFGNVQIHRFIVGVHLAGLLIAGVALGWVLRAGSRALDRVAPSRYGAVAAAAAVAIAAVALAPAWTERRHTDRYGDGLIRTQQAADATDGRDLDRLISIVKERGGGRAFAGLRGTWGRDYVVGYVPVYAWLANRDADAIGFTFRTIASLSNDPEAIFDEANPADYEMFNVRYLLLPSDRKPAVPAKLIASSGRHRLYERTTTGYFQVVDRSAPVAADRRTLADAARPFMSSRLASRAVYPGVAFAGDDGPAPTFSGASPPAGSPGRVLAQSAARSEDGVFTATVDATRPAVALLKATYDPRWTATVDGRDTKPVMMAPSLVGVDVPPGRHEVRFRYEPYDHYTLLLALGALTLIGLALYPRRELVADRVSRIRTRRRPQISDARDGAVVDRPGT